MATQELSPNNLRSALDDFSRTHQGCRTLLEDSAPNEQRREVRNLPLLGISADDRDGENQIVILLGDQPDHHLSHVVSRPSKVLIIDGNANEETIEIQTQDGRLAIIHCYKNMGMGTSFSQGS